MARFWRGLSNCATPTSKVAQFQSPGLQTPTSACPRRQQGLVAVRNKLLEAYREISSLPAGFSHDWQSDARQYVHEGSALVFAFGRCHRCLGHGGHRIM